MIRIDADFFGRSSSEFAKTQERRRMCRIVVTEKLDVEHMRVTFLLCDLDSPVLRLWYRDTVGICRPCPLSSFNLSARE